MSLQHTNRKGQTFYLHQGITKTGKPKYFFSMKRDGDLAEKAPDGFEIYENPNAQVFLRRIQLRIITDEEVGLVKDGMKNYTKLQYYQVDVKKDAIIVYEANQDVGALAGILMKFTNREADTKNLLAPLISYSPILQFVLIDETRRKFVTQRYCFLGSIDDWIAIGRPDKLQSLVKKYVKHIGQESYYELF